MKDDNGIACEHTLRWCDVREILQVQGIENPTDEELEVGADMIRTVWRKMDEAESQHYVDSYWDEYFPDHPNLFGTDE
jgi:hypothetical protein